ncbi:MAG: hypothetical protein KBA66_21935 [Leptospiraceae bacterium]|nr:hypothetical protein [Leptospiraceae bacterium]
MGITTTDKIFKIYEETYLHDLPVVSMKFLFEKRSVEFAFESFDESSKTYKPLSFLFSGVSKFISDSAPDKPFEIVELMNAEIEKRDNAYYTKLVFQQSDSVWIVELTFQDLEVVVW